MTAEHKRCYRCDRPVRDLQDPGQRFAAEHGVCDDCRLRLEAADAARRWAMSQGAEEIPRGKEGGS